MVGNDLLSASVWNQSSLMCRMVENGAGEVSYLNYSPDTTNSMVHYEGGNRLNRQSADWQERFFEWATATIGVSVK